MIRYIEIKAPAKINIGLNITEKRADGFHNLVTLFYPVKDLHDLIKIERSDKYELTCSNDDLKIDDSNLITKAKSLLENVFGITINVKIHLEKNIPMGAGMGGGSSDAAAVLLALNDMFNLNAGKEKLAELALVLGSDVPYFLKPVPSVGKSRGEILSPVKLDINKCILIINPGIHINTGEAFRNIKPSAPEVEYESIFNGDLIDFKNLGKKITNDFETYVFGKYPQIADIKSSLYKTGAEFALMTGTGSTVFGIFDSKELAEKALSGFPPHYFGFLSKSN